MRGYRVTRMRPGGETGGIAILVALLLTVLMGFAGLSVDLGNWYLRAQRHQNAADAAAMAGVVYMATDPGRAFSIARQVARQNGFEGNEVQVAQSPPGSRLRVTIKRTVPNYFAGVLGLADTHISRTAVAEYLPPVTMGSPNNTFGNEPLAAGETQWSTGSTTPQFWTNIAGPASPKRNGDAHHASTCVAEDDGCTPPVNDEYGPNGYFYSMRVTAVPEGKRLVVQAFDPAFVRVGDRCDSPRPPGTPRLAGATAATNPYVTDPATRYASGDGPYCTGDEIFGSGPPVTTVFTVRAPTDTPWDPTSGEAVSGCDTTFPGYDTPLRPALTAGPTGVDAIQRVFRRWIPLCEMASPETGDYVVQVRTTQGSGHNRFALRAAFLDDAGVPDGSDVRIFATSTMAIYANATSASSTFHLVRVPSGSGGRALVLSFFDIGDASAAGQLRIVSTDATLRNCTATGPQSGSLPDCVISASSAFNGRWERVRVPIPAGYSCDDDDASKCWVKIQYDYGADTIPTDTTTWTASIEGDPVRLVE